MSSTSSLHTATAPMPHWPPTGPLSWCRAATRDPRRGTTTATSTSPAACWWGAATTRWASRSRISPSIPKRAARRWRWRPAVSSSWCGGWRRGLGTGLLGRRYDSDGTPTPEFHVSREHVDEPTVAMGADGEVFVAWNQNGRIFGRSLPANGGPAGSSFQVSAENTRTHLPFQHAVSFSASGTAVVVWSSHLMGARVRGIYGRRYGAGGGPSFPPPPPPPFTRLRAMPTRDGIVDDLDNCPSDPQPRSRANDRRDAAHGRRRGSASRGVIAPSFRPRRELGSDGRQSVIASTAQTASPTTRRRRVGPAREGRGGWTEACGSSRWPSSHSRGATLESGRTRAVDHDPCRVPTGRSELPDDPLASLVRARIGSRTIVGVAASGASAASSPTVTGRRGGMARTLIGIRELC